MELKQPQKQKNNECFVRSAVCFVYFDCEISYGICAIGCKSDSIRGSPDCRLASCGLTGRLLSKTAEYGTLIRHFQVLNTINFKTRLSAKPCST